MKIPIRTTCYPKRMHMVLEKVGIVAKTYLASVAPTKAKWEGVLLDIQPKGDILSF